MLVKNGVVQMLSMHFSRLHQSCTRLRIKNVPFAKARQAIKDYCTKEFNQTGESVFVLKILVSRGSGGRGYQVPSDEQCEPQIYLVRSPYPKHYDLWQQKGIRLGVSDIKLGINPTLAGMKHCNRLEQVMVKQAMPNHVEDVVVLDVNNHIVECSASNIFWYKQGIWYTPSLTGSGVNGVMRQCVLAHIADKDCDFEYAEAGLSTLFESESAIICNSLTGPIVVNEIDFGTEQIRRQGQGANVVKLDSAKAIELCESVREELMSLHDGD